MNETINNIIISIGTTLVTGAFQKANNPARAIDDLMTLSGFEALHSWAEKNRIKHASNLNDFKEKIAKEILQIAIENLKDPSLNILGPALEASKYHINQEIIRDMFARLIASDIDITKENRVHPSFIEIIKQLSPLDAQNLSIIFNYNNRNIPIANYYRKFAETNAKKLLQPNVFLLNPEQLTVDFNASSLENLRRLGIVELIYNQSIANEQEYSLLKNNNFLYDIVDSYKYDNSFDGIYIEPGFARLTFFGLDFCEICLP